MSHNVEFHDESERLRLVAHARDESEYDIFGAAWTAWHGSEPQPGQLDADFGAYLREEAIPPYVRHFVRQWLEANPDLPRRYAGERRAENRARLLALALITLAVVVALFIGWRI